MSKTDINGVSYKISLLTEAVNGSKTKCEVRRFVVPQDCSTSVDYLRDKLKYLFGNNISNGFKITWKDEEGDNIKIESDEDLIIALHEMKGPLYRLSVVACNQESLMTSEALDLEQSAPLLAKPTSNSQGRNFS